MKFVLSAVLSLAPAAVLGQSTRYVLNETLATSTCNGAFNTPCSIATSHDIVDVLVANLAAAPSYAAEVCFLSLFHSFPHLTAVL